VGNSGDLARGKTTAKRNQLRPGNLNYPAGDGEGDSDGDADGDGDASVSELFFFVEAFLVVDDFFVVVSFLVAVAVCVPDAVLVVVIVSFLSAHEARNPMASRTVTEEISKRFIGCG
jgi:hypothetical protein